MTQGSIHFGVATPDAPDHWSSQRIEFGKNSSRWRWRTLRVTRGPPRCAECPHIYLIPILSRNLSPAPALGGVLPLQAGRRHASDEEALERKEHGQQWQA